ncbi:hypothetical protein BGP_3121 [Beggiatoa sp. PS]|nr:hypothetical protein BGP_3121 [Beggiatoa sp. PS]
MAPALKHQLLTTSVFWFQMIIFLKIENFNVDIIQKKRVFLKNLVF